jgi:hypothetical protein
MVYSWVLLINIIIISLSSTIFVVMWFPFLLGLNFRFSLVHKFIGQIPVNYIRIGNPQGLNYHFHPFSYWCLAGNFGNDPLANYQQSSRQPPATHPFPTFSTSKLSFHFS